MEVQRIPQRQTWQQLYQQRLRAAATWMYHNHERCKSSEITSKLVNPIKVVCISDTHGLKPDLPAGDLLLHAGDLTQNGSFEELQNQIDWLDSQPHVHKIIIAGNHDLLLDSAFVDSFPARIIERPGSARADLKWGSVIYLQDECFVAEFTNKRRLKIYGSPSTPQYGTWAFQYPPIRDVFDERVPSDTDILLTHGPPKFHLDSPKLGAKGRDARGCEHLLKEIWRLRRSLQLVVFGHIHCGYGQEGVRFDRMQINHELILLNEGGISSLLIMVILLFGSILCMTVGVRNKADHNKVRLINAAVAPGEAASPASSPIVVNL